MSTVAEAEAMLAFPSEDVAGEVWTVHDIADYLKCSDRHVRRLIAVADLPAFDIGCGEKAHDWRAFPERIRLWAAKRELRLVK